MPKSLLRGIGIAIHVFNCGDLLELMQEILFLNILDGRDFHMALPGFECGQLTLLPLKVLYKNLHPTCEITTISRSDNHDYDSLGSFLYCSSHSLGTS